MGTLHDRLKELGAIGLGKALKLIEEEKVQAEKQDETKVSFVKPITKEQTRINWDDAKEVIYNQIRGLNPFPGAHTFTETGENVKIYKSEKIDKEYEGENGAIVEIINKKGPVVKTSNGGIILLEVKFEGKKLQSGTDIINGRKLTVGNKFKN